MTIWQDLEKKIRLCAQVVWLAPASSEYINGVKCDCVVKKNSDYWVIIEVSKLSSLEKLRVDLAKFASIKPFLLAKNIYAECIFITEKEQHSLKDTASGVNVKIYSIKNFYNQYFGSENYISAREVHPFGSAIDPDSGDIDNTEYIPIKYIDGRNKEYSIENISNYLKSGNNVIILGEFGSGKSRCVMEIFKHLSKKDPNYPPVSINLKDTWGLKAFHTIIGEHFARLGLSQYAENVIRSIPLGNNVLLLDGFDELGSQAWSGDRKRIREVRKRSFEGIRDLISVAKKSGILITGREHYFNDNEELFECLGLKSDSAVVLRCPKEFSEEETQAYLKKRIGIDKYPQWFPRKPLLCQVLTKLADDDINIIVNDEIGEIKYFETTLDKICERETKFNSAVFADSVKMLYFELAKKTKEKDTRVGPLNTTDIYSAFEKVTGAPPLDESIVLLQRLAYLGRTEASSDDRVFVDEYISDGIAALAIVDDYYNKRTSSDYAKWKNSISHFGMKIIGKKIRLDEESTSYIKGLVKDGLLQLADDLFASLLNENSYIDFKNLKLNNSNIKYLDLSNKILNNFLLINPAIEELLIDDISFHNVKIINGTFISTVGVTSKKGFPLMFEDCDSFEYESATNSVNIANLSVSDSHKTLLSIIKKLFFQPGSGRRESALLRGSEKFWDKKAADKILNYLLHNKMIVKDRGDEGYIYIPKRNYNARFGKLYAELNNSSDEIWHLLA